MTILGRDGRQINSTRNERSGIRSLDYGGHRIGKILLCGWFQDMPGKCCLRRLGRDEMGVSVGLESVQHAAEKKNSYPCFSRFHSRLDERALG